MAIPADVSHVVFGGSMVGGEVWESGFWISGATPSSNAAANALAELVFTALQTTDSSGVWHAMLNNIPITTTITYAKAYCYPAGGTTAEFIGEYTATAVPGSSPSTQANQVCLVSTLRTELAGRRHRGRMYWPINAATVQAATGQYTSTTAQALATALAAFFSDWNGSGDNGVVSVVSRVGAGEATPVTAVTVDTIPDTQRRRRDKMVAVAVTSANVTGGPS